VQSHDGDDRAGHCIRDPLHLCSLLDKGGEE
jgi:hypothetical protein